MTRRFFLLEEITFKIFELLENGVNIDNINHGHINVYKSDNQIDKSLEYYISKVKTYLSFMKTEWTPFVSSNISANKIEKEFFANPQIVFEVTEKCNLACEYCAYGSYYTGFDVRAKKDLDVEDAKRIIDFTLNKSILGRQKITISFYGGEPLLKIDFIKEVVEYCNRNTKKGVEFSFSMTTNGTLLTKYIDLIIEYDIEILISLDGNRKNNAYRVFKSGLDSYDRLISNIDYVFRNHPDYFKEYVNFIAVLHNKNSTHEINEFIYERYNKYPIISELAADGVKEDMQTQFLTIYKNKHEDLLASKDYYSQLKIDNIEKTPDYDSSVYFVSNLTELMKSDFSKINNLTNDKSFLLPTGTCIPFQRKIFITTNGKILPCESIDHIHTMGFLTDKEVIIDFNEVAKEHNTYLNRLSNQCQNCYRVTSCIECVYTMWFKGDSPVCSNKTNLLDYKNYLSTEIAYLEENENVINKIIYETELD